MPLPPLVRELIGSVRAKPGNLVFTTTGTTAVSGWSRMKGRLDAAMLAAAREEGRAVIPPWTLHDLRRTFVTGMVELRVPPHVVEVTVDHIGGTRSGVAGTYNRSELMDQRKEALERWATHVAGIVAPLPENVRQPATKAEAEVMDARLKTPRIRGAHKRECIVETVLGIIGGATVIEDGIGRQIGPHDIHGVLHHLREACLTTQRFHARQSKQAMRAIKQLSAALRRANQPKGGLPEDIRLVLGLDRMIHHLAAYGKAHRKPKPDAIRKRLAADYALDLCERFGVKTTTARTGKFCLVAGALSATRTSICSIIA